MSCGQWPEFLVKQKHSVPACAQASSVHSLFLRTSQSESKPRGSGCSFTRNMLWLETNECARQSSTKPEKGKNCLCSRAQLPFSLQSPCVLLVFTSKLPHTLRHFLLLWTALLPFLKWLFPESTTPHGPLNVSVHSLLFHTHPFWLQAYHAGWLRNVPTGRINKYSALLTTALYSRVDGCTAQEWQSYSPLPLTHVCSERGHNSFTCSWSICPSGFHELRQR